MERLVLEIKDKIEFQKKILFYYKDFKNIVFLNSNNENDNYIAISNSSNCSEKEWKFGFVSYDYKNKIETHLSSENIDNHLNKELFFFNPEILYILSSNKLEILFNANVYNLSQVSEFLNKIENIDFDVNSKVEIALIPRLTKQEYLSNVNLLKEHIQLGDVYEVNYCQEFYAKNIDLNPIELYIRLNEKSPTPFSCFVKHENNYLLSASPERFLKKENDNIFSQPIKGTVKRGKNKDEDEELKSVLANDEKERSENIMIVDLVRNDLSKIAKRNTVKVDELCGIYSFPQVHQMISTVSAQLKNDVDFNTILKATFPMGSMTGAPKVRAMQLIEKYETSKRGLYSGSIGYIKPNGDFDFNVVIRSILYNKNSNYLSFFVGGAITNLSDPEKEYQECLLKAKAMFEVLC